MHCREIVYLWIRWLFEEETDRLISGPAEFKVFYCHSVAYKLTHENYIFNQPDYTKCVFIACMCIYTIKSVIMCIGYAWVG